MRSEDQIRERVMFLLIEEINKLGFQALQSEPENTLPKFLESATNSLTELCLDELTFRRRY